MAVGFKFTSNGNSGVYQVLGDKYGRRINGANNTKGFTMSCWAYSTELASIRIMQVASRDQTDLGFNFNMSSGGAGRYQYSVNFAANATAQAPLGSVVLNRWHHLVGRTPPNGGSHQLWQNGAFAGSSNTDSGPTTDNDCSAVGLGTDCANGTVGPMHRGWSAEFAVWDIDLQDSEIRALAKGQNPLTIRPQNLIYYNPMRQGVNRGVDEIYPRTRNFDGPNPILQVGSSPFLGVSSVLHPPVMPPPRMQPEPYLFPVVSAGITKTPLIGALSLAGQTAQRIVNDIDTPAQDGLALAGQNPTRRVNHIVAPATGALAISGQTPQRVVNHIPQPATGAVVIAGQAPSAEIDHYRDVQVGALVIGSTAPAVVTGFLTQPATGGLTITGPPPSAEIDHYRSIGADALALAGQAPARVINHIVAPATAALTLSGQAPTAGIDYYRDVATGTLTLAGQVPTVTSSLTAFPAVGSLALAGQTPTAGIDHYRDVATGTLTLAGQTPTAIGPITASPGTGSLTTAGVAPTRFPSLGYVVQRTEYYDNSGGFRQIDISWPQPPVAGNLLLVVMQGQGSAPDSPDLDAAGFRDGAAIWDKVSDGTETGTYTIQQIFPVFGTRVFVYEIQGPFAGLGGVSQGDSWNETVNEYQGSGNTPRTSEWYFAVLGGDPDDTFTVTGVDNDEGDVFILDHQAGGGASDDAFLAFAYFRNVAKENFGQIGVNFAVNVDGDPLPSGRYLAVGSYEYRDIDLLPTGAPTLAGQAPTVSTSLAVGPAAGSLALQGQAPTVLVSEKAEPDVGALALAGQAPSAEIDHYKTSSPDALSLQGAAPDVIVNHIVAPATGSVSLTGAAPSISEGIVTSPPVGTISLAGAAPTIIEGLVRDLPVGALTLQGAAPSAGIDHYKSVGSASLSLSGQAPTVTNTLSATPGAGAIDLAGQAPTVLASLSGTPAAGALALQGAAPTTIVSITVSAVLGTVSLAGNRPTISVNEFWIKVAAAGSLNWEKTAGAATTWTKGS